MAYTLKSAWASRTAVCVAVDSDNTTVKDFVTSNTMTVDSNVTVGSASFKSVTRPYFQTKANGSFNFYGLTWSGTKPNQNYDPGFSFIVLLNSYTSGGFVFSDAGQNKTVRLSSGKPTYNVGSFTANTALATGTKLGFMGTYRRGGTCEWHYGLESGSMALDTGANTDSAFAGDGDLTSYGGASGQGNFVANTHLFLMTTDTISNTDRDAIFSDFVGTLFDTGGGPTTKTITFNLKSKAGAAQINKTGIHWAVWRSVTSPTGLTTPLESGTTETTDSSGQMVIDLTNAAWVHGDTAWVVLMSSDGTMLSTFKTTVVVA